MSTFFQGGSEGDSGPGGPFDVETDNVLSNKSIPAFALAAPNYLLEIAYRLINVNGEIAK